MAARQPTNADLLRKLESMESTLQSTVREVDSLKLWRHDVELAKTVISEFRQKEYEDQEHKSVMDILKQLAPFIVALTALAYAVIQALK